MIFSFHPSDGGFYFTCTEKCIFSFHPFDGGFLFHCCSWSTSAVEAAARHLSLVAGPWLLEYDWQVTSDIILPS